MESDMTPTPPEGRVLIYQDGALRLQVRIAGRMVWLAQAAMAELFQTSPQNITLHLKSIYRVGELDEAATCKEYLQVRQEGKRQANRGNRMSTGRIDSGKQLRVQSSYTQSTRNSMRNSRLGARRISLVYKIVRTMGTARLFACKVQANYARFEAEELDTIIRQNLSACRGGRGAGREDVGYGG